MAWPPAVAGSDSESCTKLRVIEGCLMQTLCDVCQQITIQPQISHFRYESNVQTCNRQCVSGDTAMQKADHKQ